MWIIVNAGGGVPGLVVCRVVDGYGRRGEG